ncbi:MAG: hypothetical protein JWL98_1265 [Xanthomonadaceae bacterium]|nr:hypothetical protein [Xanthomonadaceae bacterium]
MSDQQALGGFTGKWLERWPEWRVAEVFVAPAQRGIAAAWFALRQELLDAAWGGSDPRPGEAKLAWWMDELNGWAQGRRRHPLGAALQRMPAPWARLALATTALASAREPAVDEEAAAIAVAPFAEAVVAVDGALFDVPEAASHSAITGLLCEHLIARGDAATPLQTRARLGAAAGENTVARAWSQEILQRPRSHGGGSRAGRILSALERGRVARFADGQPMQPIPWWPALWTAWRSARS